MKQIKKVRTDPPYTENGYSVIIYYLEINHTKVQDNEDGYHGGAGGFGGKSGEAHFHGYNRDPKFFVSKKEGEHFGFASVKFHLLFYIIINIQVKMVNQAKVVKEVKVKQLILRSNVLKKPEEMKKQ